MVEERCRWGNQVVILFSMKPQVSPMSIPKTSWVGPSQARYQGYPPGIQVLLQSTRKTSPHPGRSREPLCLRPLPRLLTVPPSSSVCSWAPFLLFFFLSVSFFSFSGRMLSIQARSCWEKTKSKSLRTMIRPKIWVGRQAERLKLRGSSEKTMSLCFLPSWLRTGTICGQGLCSHSDVPKTD